MDFLIPLTEKKNGVDAFALAVLLLIATPTKQRITQKLCGELLHSPTKGKNALAVLLHYKVVVDGKWPYWPDMTIPDREDEKNAWADVASLICKEVYGNFPSTLSLLNSIGKFITKAAEEKRMTIEEFIPIMVKEIKKDDFWSKALTAENFVRKFDSLWIKFGKNISKKPWGNLNSLKDIF